MAAESRRPLHIVSMVGLSAAIYAVNLAAVTAMQASTDVQAAGPQAPTQAALDLLRAHDAAIAAQVQQATSKLQAGAARYAQAGAALSALEKKLSGLGKSTGALSALPAVPAIGRTTAAAPVVHTTTAASGAKP